MLSVIQTTITKIVKVNQKVSQAFLGLQQTAEKKVLREIAIMKKLRHGQIVQLYEVINDPLSTKIFMGMSFSLSVRCSSCAYVGIKECATLYTVYPC